MKAAIIANPGAGRLAGRGLAVDLRRAARVLGAEVHGLDTGSPAELALCAADLSGRCDLLVVAGGDGTFSDVVNAVDTATTPLAFLPLGTGNALGRALGYRGGMGRIAARIRNGRTVRYDLIDCDGRRLAFMASVGMDGDVIRLRHHYRGQGKKGFGAYLRAVLRAQFTVYRPVRSEMNLDGKTHTVDRLLSLMVVKQPFFGFGLKAVPEARWDDGCLHTRCIPAGLLNTVMGLTTGFTTGNRVGRHRTGKHLTVALDRPLAVQLDGDLGWKAKTFTFRVRPGALLIRH